MSSLKELVPVNQLPKQDAYYVASGFFDADQIATVDRIEQSLKGLNIKHFSPRQESIAFFKEKDAEIKSMMTKLIFNNNLDCMNSCNKFIVNLQNEDMGTLFEYGYIAGVWDGDPRVPALVSSNVKVMNDKYNLEELVLSSTHGFSNNMRSKGKDYDFVVNMLKDLEYVNELYKGNLLGIFNIDDRDPINIFLIGVYYRCGLPIITYSHKEYGTNVMLVHATTHFENVVDMQNTLMEMNDKLEVLDSNKGLNLETKQAVIGKLFLNKQKWDVNID